MASVLHTVSERGLGGSHGIICRERSPKVPPEELFVSLPSLSVMNTFHRDGDGAGFAQF